MVSFEDGFSYLEIPLGKGGTIHFSIDGFYHPFHYWIYE